jgi:sister-chromatid-cohesion protein PDS5
MGDPYEYEEAPSGAELAQLAKKLCAPSTKKDALVKQLMRLSAILEASPQDVGALGRAQADLPRALGALYQQANPDKDVRLYLAVCTVHALRIWAPSTPFEDEPERQEVGAPRAVHAAPPCTLAVTQRKPRGNAPPPSAEA